MARKWRSFDARTTNAELLALPKPDFLRLTAAMKQYALDSRSGYVVRSYGEGLMMLKDDSRGQGRALFFAMRREDDGTESLTLLLVYKKETQEAPARVVDTARRRMREAQ